MSHRPMEFSVMIYSWCLIHTTSKSHTVQTRTHTHTHTERYRAVFGLPTSGPGGPRSSVKDNKLSLSFRCSCGETHHVSVVHRLEVCTCVCVCVWSGCMYILQVEDWSRKSRWPRWSWDTESISTSLSLETHIATTQPVIQQTN